VHVLLAAAGDVLRGVARAVGSVAARTHMVVDCDDEIVTAAGQHHHHFSSDDRGGRRLHLFGGDTLYTVWAG